MWSIGLFKFENYLLYFKLEQANRPQVDKSYHLYICTHFIESHLTDIHLYKLTF